MAAKTQINPNKLLFSKWTAVHPEQRQKHFIVTKLLRDDLDNVWGCVIEAVINHRQRELPWQELTDPLVWQQGWR